MQALLERRLRGELSQEEEAERAAELDQIWRALDEDEAERLELEFTRGGTWVAAETADGRQHVVALALVFDMAPATSLLRITKNGEQLVERRRFDAESLDEALRIYHAEMRS